MAIAAALTTSAARAADYSQPPPPQVYYQPPPQIETFASGWYLRGDVGIGQISGYKTEFIRNAASTSDFAFDHSSIADTFFIGAGIGYEWNSWLRFDLTGEYRAKSRVYAFGRYTVGCAPGTVCVDTYEGNLKSWVFLANAYVDLGTWNGFTPFVGAGIGGAHNTLADFTDFNPLGGLGIGRNPSEWHTAWALHAGVAYNVTKSLKIELAYRYLNFGSITDTIDCIGGCNPDSYKFSNLYSHDIKLGLRWTFGEYEASPRYYPPPPPVYSPPPLRSKG
jgi:opacity protein-like surface antigen